MNNTCIRLIGVSFLLIFTFQDSAFSAETRFLPPTPEGAISGLSLTFFTAGGVQNINLPGAENLIFEADYYSNDLLVWGGGFFSPIRNLPVNNQLVDIVGAEFFIDPGTYTRSLLGSASLTHNLVIETGQFGLHLLVDTGGPAPLDMFDIFEFGTFGFPEPDVHSIHWGTAGFEISPISGLDGLFGVQLSIENYSYAPLPAGVWLFGSGLIGLIGLGRRKAID